MFAEKEKIFCFFDFLFFQILFDSFAFLSAHKHKTQKQSNKIR